MKSRWSAATENGIAFVRKWAVEFLRKSENTYIQFSSEFKLKNGKIKTCNNIIPEKLPNSSQKFNNWIKFYHPLYPSWWRIMWSMTHLYHRGSAHIWSPTVYLCTQWHWFCGSWNVECWRSTASCSNHSPWVLSLNQDTLNDSHAVYSRGLTGNHQR